MGGKPRCLIGLPSGGDGNRNFRWLKFAALAARRILGCYQSVIVANVAVQYDMSGTTAVTTTLLKPLLRERRLAGTGDVCLSRSRALTMSFNSATSRDTPEVILMKITDSGLSGVLLHVSERTACSGQELCNPCLITKFAASHFSTSIASTSIHLGGSLEQFCHSFYYQPTCL
ncbi:hypothetical protein Tco_0256219 [Tanacetum coccineum]